MRLKDSNIVHTYTHIHIYTPAMYRCTCQGTCSWYSCVGVGVGLIGVYIEGVGLIGVLL
jgi:hypothetical protein